MKTMMIMLTASALLGLLAVPMVTAAESMCGRADTAGSVEAMPTPGRPGSYLFLDLTQPAKVGEWTESNTATGLQTIACFKFGVYRYGPDAHASILG